MTTLKTNTSYLNKLDETEKYIVGNNFEEAYLVDKRNNNRILLGTFYGDPSCALIAKNNEWCLVGGDELILWTEKEGIEIIGKNTLQWIHDLRYAGDNMVEILIDPWCQIQLFGNSML